MLEAEVARREELLAETAGTGVDDACTADLEAEVAVLRGYLA